VLTGGGCSSKLTILDASKAPSEIKGIRVHQRVPYILTKEIETEKCQTKIEESIVHLPVGDPYDINFVPSAFAKSEFSVTLNDDGGLKQVTLNSTPQLAETIKSVADLTEKVSKLAIAGAGAPQCGAVVSETISSVRRLPIKAE